MNTAYSKRHGPSAPAPPPMRQTPPARQASRAWCMPWLCALWCCLAWPLWAAPSFHVAVQFPTGQTAQPLDADSPLVAAVRPGESLTGLIQFEHAPDSGVAVSVAEVTLAADFPATSAGLTLHPFANAEPQPAPPGAIRHNVVIPGRISPYLQQFALTAPRAPGRYTIEMIIQPAVVSGSPRENEDPPAPIRGTLTLEVVTPEQMARAIEIDRVIFPADPEGRPWTGRASDTVAFPSEVWSALAFLMGRRTGHNPYEPYAWISVRLRHTLPRSATVLVQTGPVSAGDHDPAPDVAALFAYDWWTDAPRTFTQTALLTLGSGEERTVALPLYVSPAALSGRYACPIAVQPGGGGEPLASVMYRFRIQRERGGVAVFVIALALGTGAGVLLLPGYLRRLLPRLYVRQMVMVSLFGALTVAGAVLINVLNSPLQGLLGPFNAFVGGFFYRLLMAALWLSLLTLLPYRGVVTLTALIAYFIGGIFFGSFNPMDFMLVGSGIFYKEALLALAGATHPLPPLDAAPRAALPPAPTLGFVLRVAVALGLAEAASTFTSLALQMVFYRLYFADWYIWAVVIVQSFGYMALGVMLSRGPARLVHRLSSPTL